jgi:hypothetical protein
VRGGNCPRGNFGGGTAGELEKPSLTKNEHEWRNGLLENWSVAKSAWLQYSIPPLRLLSICGKN